TDAELFSVKSLALLTLKPIIIVLNSGEKALNQEQLQIGNYPTLRICASIEAQIANLPAGERLNLLKLYNIKGSGLDLLISKAYDLLGYITFLTAGEKEVRAWPIPKDTKAPQAAGTIHSDFENHFIKAKVAAYDDFVACNGWNGLKNIGKTKIEGKDYIVNEGDVIEFMTNA
ncbi:DUF933 domain-containing protein, partial [Patescibacteria group bacterium]|nr:DUF933 domain-containing protein [Patescibacteria group bacterium]